MQRVRESVGLPLNRIWHATRRECLSVVAEAVSTPGEVDRSPPPTELAAALSADRVPLRAVA